MEIKDYEVTEQNAEDCKEGSEINKESPKKKSNRKSEAKGSDEGRKTKKIVISIISLLLVVLIVASLVICIIPMMGSSEGYEDVAMEYARSYAQGDVLAIGDTSITDLRAFYEAQLESDSGGDAAKKKQFFAEASEYYGKTISNIDEYIAAGIEENKKGITSYYGEYTVETKILSAERMSAETLASLKESIEAEKNTEGLSLFMNVDASKITDGYQVEVEVSIKGTLSESTNPFKCTVVKYDGDWAVVPGV